MERGTSRGVSNQRKEIFNRASAAAAAAAGSGDGCSLFVASSPVVPLQERRHSLAIRMQARPGSRVGATGGQDERSTALEGGGENKEQRAAALFLFSDQAKKSSFVAPGLLLHPARRCDFWQGQARGASARFGLGRREATQSDWIQGARGACKSIKDDGP